MAKEQLTRPQNINEKVAFYKSAALPWVLIIILLTALSGFIGGWHVRSGHMLEISEVRAEVSEQLKAQANITAKK